MENIPKKKKLRREDLRVSHPQQQSPLCSPHHSKEILGFVPNEEKDVNDFLNNEI